MLKVGPLRGIDKVRQFLATLTKQVKNIAEPAIAEYLIGDRRHGLKYMPPYRHVPFTIGAGWSMDPEKRARQRAWLFKAIADGRVGPGMSASEGRMSDAWTLSKRGNVWQIQNDVAHTKWLMGNQEQTAHARKQGYRKVSEVIASNLVGALRHAVAEIKRLLIVR